MAECSSQRSDPKKWRVLFRTAILDRDGMRSRRNFLMYRMLLSSALVNSFLQPKLRLTKRETP